MCAKGMKEEDYEEQMHWIDENDRRGLDASCKKLQNKADLGPQQPKSPFIKEEEQEDEISNFPLTYPKSEREGGPSEASVGVEPSKSPQSPPSKDGERRESNVKEKEDEIRDLPPNIGVKREQDDGLSVANGGAEPSSSRQHLPVKDEGDQCDGFSAPLSNSDDATSYSSEFDDDDDSSGDLEFHPRKNRDESSSKSSLKREHVSGKSFACLFCKKIFPSRSRLTKHTRVHTGEKPFSCSVCTKKFAQKENLKKHTRTHTGEKPFACSVCGQRFAQKENLTSHARTHTGEKPYACSFCGQRFAQKGNLTTHTRTHTGEKPFACSVCSKRFTKKTHLTDHARTHTGRASLSLISKTF
ncbi:uncharacterized protein LOC144194223 isoform X2 [Stigmatopora nigra]